MDQYVRVELVRRTIPADEETLQRRADIVERMRSMGHLDEGDEGRVSETMDGGWVARIDGVEVPVVTYSVEPAAEGVKALVSLLVAADSVQVGDPSTGTGAPPVRPAASEQKPPLSTWGAQGKPDPREGIPGWRPNVAVPSISAKAAGVVA